MKLVAEWRVMLLRIGWWFLVACAAATALWLVSEGLRAAQDLPDQGWNLRSVGIVGLVLVNLLFTCFFAIVGFVYLWGRMANSLPDLQRWHLERPESEFRAADVDKDYNFDDYLRQEELVFEQLSAFIAGSWSKELPIAYGRYCAKSVCNPETILDRNWNRSHVLTADNPIGGVLLLHGLSDSPYSLRVLGQRLHSQGYTVIWLRLPGHGTCPNALANVSWQDWTAAVRTAVLGLCDRLPTGVPLILGGFSNGGALTVHYTLSAINDTSLPKPNAIVLFSPMIGISPLARITRFYHLVALIFRNQKAQWSNIVAEIDPFRFSSWPMNASVQAWTVTQQVERQLARLDKSGRMHEMPPVLALQSVVDSTVVVPKLITSLFNRLESSASELVLYDINRLDRLANLFNMSFQKTILPAIQDRDLPYTLRVLTNAKVDSLQVVLRTVHSETQVEISTDMQWPAEFASLSHIAVPFPPDDPLYGTSQATAESGLSIGTFSMRAEPKALLLASSLFYRSRHNPFYGFTEDHLVSWLDKVIS